MRQTDSLLSEWEHEARITRRTLERIPQDKLSWKPHHKSMSLGALAMHIANLPSWAEPIFNKDSFNPTREKLAEADSVEEIVRLFQDNAKKLSMHLKALPEESLERIWTFGNPEKPIFSLPKGYVIRSFLFSHLIHHRAQLGVYLRLLDVPVPSTYGPSADEN